jgi:hypothetical protein
MDQFDSNSDQLRFYENLHWCIQVYYYTLLEYRYSVVVNGETSRILRFEVGDIAVVYILLPGDKGSGMLPMVLRNSMSCFQRDLMGLIYTSYQLLQSGVDSQQRAQFMVGYTQVTIELLSNYLFEAKRICDRNNIPFLKDDWHEHEFVSKWDEGRAAFIRNTKTHKLLSDMVYTDEMKYHHKRQKKFKQFVQRYCTGLDSLLQGGISILEKKIKIRERIAETVRRKLGLREDPDFKHECLRGRGRTLTQQLKTLPKVINTAKQNHVKLRETLLKFMETNEIGDKVSYLLRDAFDEAGGQGELRRNGFIIMRKAFPHEIVKLLKEEMLDQLRDVRDSHGEAATALDQDMKKTMERLGETNDEASNEAKEALANDEVAYLFHREGVEINDEELLLANRPLSIDISLAQILYIKYLGVKAGGVGWLDPSKNENKEHQTTEEALQYRFPLLNVAFAKLINHIAGMGDNKEDGKKLHTKYLAIYNNTVRDDEDMEWKKCKLHYDFSVDQLQECEQLELDHIKNYKLPKGDFNSEARQMQPFFLVAPVEHKSRLLVEYKYTRLPGRQRKDQKEKEIEINVGDIVVLNWDKLHATGTMDQTHNEEGNSVYNRTLRLHITGAFFEDHLNPTSVTTDSDNNKES